MLVPVIGSVPACGLAGVTVLATGNYKRSALFNSIQFLKFNSDGLDRDQRWAWAYYGS